MQTILRKRGHYLINGNDSQSEFQPHIGKHLTFAFDPFFFTDETP